MLKPDDRELRKALDAAEKMRKEGRDPDHIAKSLLYLQHRMAFLETVFDAASKYIHFGQEEREHAELVRAIEAVKREELKEVDYLA